MAAPPPQNYYYYAAPGQAAAGAQGQAQWPSAAYGHSGAMPGMMMYSTPQYWTTMGQPVMYQYNPQLAAGQPSTEATGVVGSSASAADFGEFVSTTTPAATPSASAVASTPLYGAFMGATAPAASSSSIYSGYTSAIPSAASASSLYGGSAHSTASNFPLMPASTLLTPTTTHSLTTSSSASSTLSPSLMAFSPSATVSNPQASSAASSTSSTVSSFFASLIKPSNTSSVNPAPVVASRGPSLNALATGPPAAVGVGSAPSDSSLSTEFEEFVSAPAPAQPAIQLAVKSAMTSPPASGGFAASSAPLSSSLLTPVSSAPQISPVLTATPIAVAPSSSNPSAPSRTDDFEMFLSSSAPSAAAPSASQSKVPTPPVSQGNAVDIGLGLLPASPVVQATTSSIAVPTQSDDDWSFMTGSTTKEPPVSAPAAKPQAAATSKVDSLMHKFANIEKKTLAGEAAKKPERTAPQVSSQPHPSAAAKNQSSRAFNWNDDSYRDIFSSLPATQASTPTATDAEEDFGEFVSDTAPSSVAGTSPYSGLGTTMPGFVSQPFETPNTQPRSEAAPTSFAAFPSAATALPEFQSATAAYEYYSQMASAYGASMAFANQPAVSAASTAEQDADEWTTFSSQPTVAAPRLDTSATSLGSPSLLSSFAGSASSSAPSASVGQPVLPFSLGSSPLMPTSSAIQAPAPSAPVSLNSMPLIPSSHGQLLMPSNDLSSKPVDPIPASINVNGSTMESSSEFGSFTAFEELSPSTNNGSEKASSGLSPAIEKPSTIYPGQVDWQEQTLRHCLSQLQQGSVLFQQLIQISDMNLLNKTLKSDKVDFYVRGLCEVYKIGRRMSKEWNADVAKELRPQIEDAWAVLQAVLSGLSFSSVDLQRWQEQLEKAEKQAWSGRSQCKLCFSPVTPLEAQIQLHGSLYHAPCANFYASLRQIPSAN